MDDVDVLLTCRVPLDAMTSCLERIVADSAVTEENPAYVIFSLPDQQPGAPALQRRRLAVVGDLGSASRDRDYEELNDGSDDEPCVKFVQYEVTPAWLLLDLASSCVSLDDGNRLMRERSGYSIDRSMVPSAHGGSYFNESLQRVQYRYRSGSVRKMASEAALEGCWIWYDLWAFDVGIAIQVSAFTRNGSGQVHHESGSLYKTHTRGGPSHEHCPY